MAKIFPSLDEIKNGRVKAQAGELYLLEALGKGLDDTYEIYFQPLLNGDFPDIVVFRKNRGVYIIEVKDWNLECYEYKIEEKNGKPIETMYVREEQARIRIPMNQVREYRDNIKDIYSVKLYEKILFYRLKSALEQENTPNPNFIINTAVYFHKSSENQIKSCFGNLDKTNSPNKYVKLFGYDSINLLIKNIKNKSEVNLEGNFDEVFDEIAELLRPSLDYIDQRAKVNNNKLSAEQLQLSKYSQGMKKKIRGKAGSGKSLILANLAINAMKSLEQNNRYKRVLVLHYNITLRNRLRDMISRQYGQSFGDKIWITHFNDFISKALNFHDIEPFVIRTKKTKILPSERNIENKEIIEIDSMDFNEYMKSAIKDLYDCKIDEIFKQDVILIDEGQDFKKEWFALLRDKFLNKNGSFVIFADEKQNIYETDYGEERLPNTGISGRWNELKKTYRSNYNLMKFALEFQKYFLENKYQLDYEEHKEINENRLDPDYYGQVYIEDDIKNISIQSIVNRILNLRDEIHISDIAILGSKVNALQHIDYKVRKECRFKTNTVFANLETMQEIYKNMTKRIKEAQDKGYLDNNGITEKFFFDVRMMNAFKAKRHEIDMRTLERFYKNPSAFLSAIDDEIARIKKFAFQANSGKIKISTIHSFKGWESYATILLIGEKMNPELIYTGITRAKEILYILSGNVEFNNFIKQFNRNKNKIIF
ncbi:DNA/RNA helicase domain-containing protein [Campylobacter sp. P0085]|uniref:DNA/RNA helicase domain-containing protein n=1 Tax=Campylobacter sp. P0085 TaxID=1895597 RepID=UPI000A34B55B|nr:DNA/RNA helicase domain-containing protein [Campylobacter sp. P0085]